MAAADGFAQGLQGGLGMFNAMQNASYQQQLMQNAEENQQMRRQGIALKQQEMAAAAYQQRLTRNQFVISNADKMDEETVIASHNELNEMMGGRHRINKTEIDTFKADSTSYLNLVKNARNDEEANKIITDYRAKSATHPIFNQYGQGQIKLMEDARSRKNLVHELEVLGIGNQHWREQIVSDGDPAVIREMVKNNDQRGMMMHQWSQNVMMKHETGEKVAPSDLSTAIAFLHTKSGGELKKGGKEIFDPGNRAQFEQETLTGLGQAQQAFSPLFQTASFIKPADLEALKAAKNETRTRAGYLGGTIDGVPDGSIFGGLASVKHENDAVKQVGELFKKYPQFQQQLNEAGPKADEQVVTYTRQLQQLERDKVAVEAAVTLPNRTEHLERLDQQIAHKKEQMAPWKTVSDAFHGQDSPEMIKKLLNLDKHVTKSMKEHESLRVMNLTEQEKNAAKTIDLAQKSYHVDKAGPAFVEHAVMAEIAKHPEEYQTDESRLGLLAKHGEDYKKQYGLMPNLNEAGQRIIAARMKSEDNTVTKLTPEQGFKFETAVTGAENTRSLIQGLFPDGKLDRGALATAFAGGLPFTGGKTIQSYIKDALDAEYRARTGAAMPESEWDRALDTFVPGQTDTDKSAETKLTNLLRHFENKLNLVDPDSKLRGRIKPVTSVGDVSGKQDAPKVTLDGFKQFWKQNRDKFNGDMNAASQAYHGG
jgi:hypothetical protein